MSDYSLGHFNFAIKKSAPKDVVKALDAFVTDAQEFMVGPHRIYLGNSAYHREKTYALSELPADEYRDGVEKRYSMTFQIKYGCAQLQAFAEWLGPHVVVDRNNRGFIGYKISEYSDTVTTFIIGADGKLKPGADGEDGSK